MLLKIIKDLTFSSIKFDQASRIGKYNRLNKLIIPQIIKLKKYIYVYIYYIWNIYT